MLSKKKVYPNIETRRAKGQNGAAYQHRRRRSSHADTPDITRGGRMEYQRSHSMFLTHKMQDSPPSHGPIALRCPGNGRFPPMSARR
jgi:hypothetical protein